MQYCFILQCNMQYYFILCKIILSYKKNHLGLALDKLLDVETKGRILDFKVNSVFFETRNTFYFSQNNALWTNFYPSFYLKRFFFLPSLTSIRI